MRLGHILIFLLYVGICSTKIDTDKHPNRNIEHVKSYCGIGYDLVSGNPMGDPSDQGDFGYKSSIILQPKITTDVRGNFKVEGNTRSFWIRKNNYCWNNTEPGEIKNNDDYLKALYNDFDVDNALSNNLLKANASSKIMRAIKDHGKYRIRKSYCSIYESGIVLPYKGIVARGFQEYVGRLPVLTNETSECSADMFLVQSKNKECINIRKWIDFFKVYGTHIVTHVITGGKVMYTEKSANISELSKEDENEMKDTSKKTKNFKKRIRGSKESKQVSVLGGYYIKGLENRRNFSDWTKTVSERPMPIKAKFVAISELFPDKHLSYVKALKYYYDLFGLNAGLSIVENVSKIFEGDTLTSNGGTASCPESKYTISGFSMQIDKKLEIANCIPGRYFAFSPCRTFRDVCPGTTDSSIWLLCGNSGFQELITLSFSREQPRCPQGFTIALGFYIEYKEYKIITCQAGIDSNTHEHNQGTNAENILSGKTQHHG
ncbi:MAC/Perforin domain containing protein [Theileria equi strain WA]|uniref:MAC/Perforin domain containing protein n=1 Tax=Theileria equi strain WA TaxID=1537102 RepID=L1LD01_THEEQ|nr:MAC/Perforin domain containing protein [Theileria equi strain WA]EKX73130.1 MAC/Perforin domain containing protein [Theileria equi strain WA]|eukprot:XP_004832582.1 MAC/Perforin domain containing protein [Theileria equi strain WA]